MDHPLKYIRATQRWKAKNQQAQASMRKDDEPLDVENSEGNDSDESVKNLTSE
jgi:hypothetical protein